MGDARISQLQIEFFSKWQEYLPQKSARDAKKYEILCAFCASLRLIDFEFFVPLCLRGKSGSGLSGLGCFIVE